MEPNNGEQLPHSLEERTTRSGALGALDRIRALREAAKAKNQPVREQTPQEAKVAELMKGAHKPENIVHYQDPREAATIVDLTERKNLSALQYQPPEHPRTPVDPPIEFAARLARKNALLERNRGILENAQRVEPSVVIPVAQPTVENPQGFFQRILRKFSFNKQAA